MKSIAACLLFSSLAMAETWTGAILDMLCRPENVAAG